MELIRPGSAVELGPDSLIAQITQVCIEGSQLAVKYECVWWTSGNRNTCWVTEDEFTLVTDDADKAKYSIGWHNQAKE